MSKHVQEQGCELSQVGCPEAELVRVLPPGHDPAGGGDPHPLPPGHSQVCQMLLLLQQEN